MMKKACTAFLTVFILILTACGSNTATPSRFTAWGKSVDEILKMVSNNQSKEKDVIVESIDNYCYDGTDAQIAYDFDADGLTKTTILIDIDEDKCDPDIWKRFANSISKKYGDPIDESSIGAASQTYSWKSMQTNIEFMYINIAEKTVYGGPSILITYEKNNG